MIYKGKSLKDGRYGIFINDELAATINCPEAFQKFMKALEEKVRQDKRIQASRQTYR